MERTTVINIELAWAAGVIEGEGCFSYHPAKGGRKAYVRIQVGMTDLDILQRLHSISGVGVVNGPYLYKRKNGSPAKPIWSWAVQKQADVAWLLMQLRPWMGERRTDRIDECLTLMGVNS